MTCVTGRKTRKVEAMAGDAEAEAGPEGAAVDMEGGAADTGAGRAMKIGRKCTNF
jgi:hypothetical protein